MTGGSGEQGRGVLEHEVVLARIAGICGKKTFLALLGTALAGLAILYYIFLPVPFEYQVVSAIVLLIVSIGLARYRPDLKMYLV